MIFKIATPLSNCIETASSVGKGDYIYPVPDAVSAGSRMFIVCDVKGHYEIDEVACRAVLHAVSDAVSIGHDATKPFEESIFYDALHSASDVLDSIDCDDGGKIRKGDVAVAFALLHRGGCFFATTGRAQVMLVRPGEGIVFRSRNFNDYAKLGDVNSEHRIEASVRNITDIRPGDYIYLSNDQGGIMADDEITRLMTDDMSDEDKLRHLTLATVSGSKRREYLVHVADVQKEDAELERLPQKKKLKSRVLSGPLFVAVVTALLALWFMFVFAVASYFFDRINS